MPEAAVAAPSPAPTTQAAPPAPAPEAAKAPEPAKADDGPLLNASERLVQAKAKARAELAEKDKAKPDAPAAVEAAPDLEKERAERRARIEALQAKGRADLAKNDQRKRNAPAPAAKPAENPDEIRIPRARAAELAEIEKALDSEDAFLTLAEKRGMTADKLATHIRERLSNPERIAGREAQRAVSAVEARLLAELKSRDEAYSKEIAELKGRETQREQAALIARAQQEMVSHVTAHARVAPLSARYLEKHGPEKYLQLATNLAEYVPEGAGPQAVQDSVEEWLEQVQLGAAEPSRTKPAFAAVSGTTATTVTNTLASQQTAVPDDEAFARLTPDERLKIVKARKG